MSALHIFASENSIFTSQNITILPAIPSFSLLSTERDHCPSETNKLCWASNSYPQIAFIPCRPSFNSPLFKRLDDKIIIEPVGAKWQLSSNTHQSWYRLEWNLKTTSDILTTGFSFPLQFSYFPFPSSYGYMRTHSSRRIAKRCIETSRSAFVQLAAMCSLGISLRLTESDLHSPNPRWVGMLRDRGVHPVWVDNFRKSQFADFVNTERFGSIIHPGCQWLTLVPAMQLAQVPLLFSWPNGEREAYSKTMSKHIINRFCPSVGQISAAKALVAAHDRQSTGEHISTHSFESSLTYLPDREKGSGQMQGETWLQFFDRRRVLHQMRALAETPAAKQVRLAHEKAAENHPRPERYDGPRVWQWVADINAGFLLRKSVARRQVDDIWDCFSPSQRIFNGFDNEWDLCTQLDPGVQAPDGEGEDEGRDYEILPEDGHLTLVPPAQETCKLFLEDVRTLYDDLYDNSHDLFDHREEPVGDLLYYRYGFHQTIDFLASSVATADDVLYVTKTLAIGEKTPLDADPTAIFWFIHGLREGTPPASLWDLAKSNEAALVRQANRSVVVEIYRLTTKTIYVIEPGVQPLRKDASWKLVVESAATAVECLRRPGFVSSRYSLAGELLARGIPFRTVEPLRVNVDIPRRPVLYCHPPRPVGHIPDVYDYREYEEELKAFLLEEVHARAALLKGGLVWRLVKEVLGNRLDHCAVLGPSANVHVFGSNLKLQVNGPDLWDDDLSASELDFICGVVPVYTGEFDQLNPRSLLMSLTGQGTQKYDTSWWPKNSLFEQSPLNVGYWSAACERWFSTRLSEIRSRRARARTAKEWRNSMKLWKPTLALISGNEKAAVDFLENR